MLSPNSRKPLKIPLNFGFLADSTIKRIDSRILNLNSIITLVNSGGAAGGRAATVAVIGCCLVFRAGEGEEPLPAGLHPVHGKRLLCRVQVQVVLMLLRGGWHILFCQQAQRAFRLLLKTAN